MNTCIYRGKHENILFLVKIASSLSIVFRPPCYKQKISSFIGILVASLGNIKNYNSQALEIDIESIYTSNHTPCNPTENLSQGGDDNTENYCSQTSEVDINGLYTSIHSPDNPSKNISHDGDLSKYTCETHPILQASGLQHWFKNWQNLRKNKLTASTFAGAIGFWPRRRVQLWLEKIGAIEPFTGNLATCWSNIKEEEALERYKLITGNPVLFPEFQVYSRNPEDDWLAASPDGVVVYELPSYGVLEVKCPYFGGDMRKALPWSRIPLFYIPQAQGLMEITESDWMDLYVWTPNGSSLFRLYRDEEYWDVMKMALFDFWWKHVQPARELYDTNIITNPLTQLSSLKPAPKHEICSYIVYESKRIVDNSKLLVREIHGKLQMP